MITFEKVSYKNFLSTGNTPTTIYLNRVPTALITGHNGAGKSTILDAITYGLYGKPYRNINKPQLINSVNEKNLLVELDFVINQTPYRVIRGIKPAIFEIYRNEELIAHDAAAKDYQKRLEDVIGMNYKAFSQIVILGSARYQSFMDLSSIDRRTIIEEILDITVFGTMNSILKSRAQNTDIDIKENNYQKEIVKTKISGQKGMISKLSNIEKESEEKIEQEKARIKLEISNLEDKKDKLLTEAENVRSYEEVQNESKETQNKLTDAKMKGNDIMRKEKEINKRIDFYQNNDHCEACEQPITTDLKEQQFAKLNEEKQSVLKVKPLVGEAYNNLNTKIEKLNEEIEQAKKIESEVSTINTEIKSLNSYINNLSNQSNRNSTEDIEEAKLKLKEFEEEFTSLEKENIVLLEDKHNQEICKMLLKDDGIKAKIIKQYLPVINSLINKYLDKMGANYSFNLDEQFSEVIKSRYRDTFSYASFSEGEKSRIDVALMLTWREIAKIKNSVATNLLILDEIGDSSMDGEGTDVLWEILNDMTDTNIFVISHKTSNVDKFTSHIEFVKEGNFSKIIDSK